MSAPRTSETHPLRIDAVRAPGPGAGRIGLTFCPGKRQRDAATGWWERDLATDLEAVRAWGAAALVCLVEESELVSLGVASLVTEAEARGLEAHHLPIRDAGVPDAAFERAWTYAGERLRAHLAAGRDVVLHCKGGLGRTGTIAARLLAELGVDAQRAIAGVRAARPGTIETAEQCDHARAVRPVATDPRECAWRRRVLGSLLGGAVGDAFGYAVEFDALETIRRRYGPDGIRAPVRDRHGRLAVSDDTQMTLFTLEALVDALEDGYAADVSRHVERTREALLDWHATQASSGPAPEARGALAREPVLRASRAPGRTCLSALAAGGHGAPGNPINDSKGCGGVMRVAPLGFVPESFGADIAFELGARTAAITHTHPTGYLAAGVMAAAVHALVAGSALRPAIEGAVGLLRGREHRAETEGAVRAALGRTERAAGAHRDAVASLGEGWIAEEALAIGVYAAIAGRDLPEVLAIAANHDGDSDSTASIAGQLHGAAHGLETLPHEWARRLDVLDPALGLVGRLIAATGAGGR